VVSLSHYNTGRHSEISDMTTPDKEPPIEERIGNVIGKIFCLFLFAFFIWAYWGTMAAQLGLFR
jgi:hypothetical protein